MQIRLLNAGAVRELLPMSACIDAMRQAMSLVATGDTIQSPSARRCSFRARRGS